MAIKSVSPFLLFAAISVTNVYAMNEPVILVRDRKTGQVVDVIQLHKIDPNDIPSFSNSITEKHALMVRSPEHKQYQDTKKTHRQLRTKDSLYMRELCKKELEESPVHRDWVNAIQQTVPKNTNPNLCPYYRETQKLKTGQMPILIFLKRKY
jgi:hypothetical protein